LQSELKDWIANADIIIIPTRTTSRDIEPLMRMQQAVGAAQRDGKPVVYVLNGWNRWRASSDFLEWFKENSGDVPIYKLPQSEQFVQAGASGVSVVEYARHGSAAKSTLELCNAVRKLAGFKREK
jgi:chromosome partitioning protein